MKKPVLILISSLLLSCSSLSERSPDDLIAAYAEPEYPLLVKREIQDISYAVKYIPPAIQLLEEINYPDIPAGLKSDSLERMLKQYAGMQQFVVKISSKEKKDLLGKPGTTNPEFSDKLVYLNGYVQEDFFLVNNSDTIPCAFAHFERSYGLENSITLIVGFELASDAVNSDLQLLFNDQLTGTGPVQFRFDQDSFEQFNKRISI